MNPISRRDFVAAIALGVASVRTLAQVTESKAAVIGHTVAGDYGHGLDLVFKNLPNARVLAVADQNDAGRQKAKERIGAERAYADYREMLAKEKPSLISVAPRWNDERFDMIKAALNAGAHVFSEKPFTMSLRESALEINGVR